jgi:hypothetical protein
MRPDRIACVSPSRVEFEFELGPAPDSCPAPPSSTQSMKGCAWPDVRALCHHRLCECPDAWRTAALSRLWPAVMLANSGSRAFILTRDTATHAARLDNWFDTDQLPSFVWAHRLAGNLPADSHVGEPRFAST